MNGFIAGIIGNIPPLILDKIASLFKLEKVDREKTNVLQIPAILDPVGAGGASELRHRTTAQLLKEAKISVLLGNISEIRFVAGLKATTKGVDTSEAERSNHCRD